MTPSRELDALVAEKVMGWKVMGWKKIPGTMYATWGLVLGPKEISVTDVMVMTPPEGDTRKEVPYYSTDISAAWEVVEKMSETHSYCLEKANDSHGTTVWFVPKQGFKQKFQVVEDMMDATAETSCSVPHAICLAALKAVGYDVPNS